MSLQGLGEFLRRAPLPMPVSVLVEVAVSIATSRDRVRSDVDAIRAAIEKEFRGSRRGQAMALEFIPAIVTAAPARPIKQPTDDAVYALASRLKAEPEAFDKWMTQAGPETLDEMCERFARSYLVEDLNQADDVVVRAVRIGERYGERPRAIGGPSSRGPLGLD